MICHDESEVLNYQEPHNYLCRYINFHKPRQITFCLPPPVCLQGSERQQEGTSLELFINAPGISLDLHFIWEKKIKRKRRSWLVFSSFSHMLHVCGGGPGIFAFCLPLSLSILSHSYYRNLVPVLPWLSLLLGLANTLSTWKRKN